MFNLLNVFLCKLSFCKQFNIETKFDSDWQENYKIPKSHFSTAVLSEKQNNYIAEVQPMTSCLHQECATRDPGAEILRPAERSRFWSKLYGFERVLPIFHGWPASCLTLRAWHMQLWPVEQSDYLHLAQQCCMVAHP